MTGIGRPEKVNDDATAVASYTVAALLLVCSVAMVFYFENIEIVPATTAEVEALIYQDSECT